MKLNAIITYWTQSNVTFWIAIAGFLMSALTCIHMFWETQKHLSVAFDFGCVYGTAYISSRYHNATFALFFENKSLNPIAVTYVEFETVSGGRFRASLETCFVAHRFQCSIDPGTSNYDTFLESADFPIELCGFGAAYEYVDFSLPIGNQWNDITRFIIHTNRGSVTIKDASTICKLQEFLQRPLLAHP